jgi:hypothetical protein
MISFLREIIIASDTNESTIPSTESIKSHFQQYCKYSNKGKRSNGDSSRDRKMVIVPIPDTND